MIKIHYDAEGDLLEVQFAQSSDGRRAVGLTEQITIFYDEQLETPLGLTAIAYAKLLALSKHPFTELLEAPNEVQKKVKESLQKDPLSRFIHLHADDFELEDIRMSELVHP